MTVRAKFTVQSVTQQKHWDAAKWSLSIVKLQPVISGSEENQSFYEATPCGGIELGMLNDAAAAQFELGKSYFVDFTPAE